MSIIPLVSQSNEIITNKSESVSRENLESCFDSASDAETEERGKIIRLIEENEFSDKEAEFYSK